MSRDSLLSLIAKMRRTQLAAAERFGVLPYCPEGRSGPRFYVLLFNDRDYERDSPMMGLRKGFTKSAPGARVYSVQRRKTSEPLVPPNPKEFDSAI